MTRYELVISSRARRALTDELPESVAAAVFEFLVGPLIENPARVGKPLVGALSGLHAARRGEYRVVYRILDQVVEVHVVSIAHRRDVYRA